MSLSLRRPIGACVCILALATTLGDPATALPPQQKAGPPVAMPATPVGLPAPGSFGASQDAPAPYQPQLMCAAKAQPGTVKLRALALATYARGGTSPATPRSCASGSASEHKDGRAWDWMVSCANRADRKAAANFLSWITADNGAMASRLGIMYVIYNRKIWASYSPGWRDYTGSDPHTSHVHISLSWNGARAHTSFWTGKTWPLDYGACQVFAGQPALLTSRRVRTVPCNSPAPTPVQSTQPLLWLGSTGARIGRAQRLLGITVTNTFDLSTRAVVARYQLSHDLPRTGAIDDPTWARLLPTSIPAAKPAWTPKAGARWAARRDFPEVRKGDAGTKVYALQSALRVPPAQRTSYYGRATRLAVLAAQDRLGQTRSARVTATLWSALPLPPKAK